MSDNFNIFEKRIGKMRKFLFGFIVFLLLLGAGLYAFNYYVPYSEGYRAGKLIKLSRKGIFFKTWEGELSLGIGHDQRWAFSVEKKDKEVRAKLLDLQGQDVRVKYIERFWQIPWMGDTKYFVKDVMRVDEEIPMDDED